MRNADRNINVTPIRPNMRIGKLPTRPQLPAFDKPVTLVDLLLIAGQIDQIRSETGCTTAQALVLAISEELDAA